MAYCVTSDVLALNTARVAGQGNNPTVDQIQVYINMVAGEIDAILINKGYAVPVDPSFVEAISFLNGINAKGALSLMERAAPSSIIRDQAYQDWMEAKQTLIDAQSIMDVPKDVARAEPRGPGVTVAPGTVPGAYYDPVKWYGSRRQDNPSNRPMFARNMNF